MAEDAFSIHTETVGDSAEAVAFLPGLFGQGKNFNQIAKGLEPDFRSVLVDLPNHGQSDWTEGFDYTEHADLVAGHLRATDASETAVHLVGHSLGGKVAMVLALRHPELIRSLTVVDISPAARESMDEFEHLLSALLSLNTEQITSRRQAHDQLKERIPEDMVRGFLLQSLARTDEGYQWMPNLSMLYDALGVIAGFPEFRTEEFTGPVLWVAGDRSDYVSDEHAPEMRRLFPRVRQTTVKNSGHWVHSEQPTVFTAVLKRFLTSAVG